MDSTKVKIKVRCQWCEKDDLYKNYHDLEWGVPIYDDQLLFEFLLLENFQAGLSWYTILKKRESFRDAFDQFNYHKISKYNLEKIEELMQNPGIVRNMLKIKASVTNAQQFLSIQKEYGSFSDYIWSFVDGKPIVNHPATAKEVPVTTEISDQISKDLKKNGFKFVGSTIVYAFMQATGMVNDHLESCSFKFQSSKF